MSSLGGRIGSRFNGMHYSATKAGLIGMSRTLALEVSKSGVTVNCIAPGRIATEDNKRFGTPQALIDNYIPAGRLGTPDDVAAAICFLASDDASYITGATLDVNGGFYMG
jgi:NAD(P)-dependent dehydrogenase (short-subunit alcohol dehydrogenase family)